MTPRLAKFALTAHVTFSVGWLGAVASFLALAVAGLSSRDAPTVRAAYLAMQLTGWFVIVPLGLASLLSGLVQSLGTAWGLFRHYWILAKLLLTILATVLLLVHMQVVDRLAVVAAETTSSLSDLHGLRIQLVADAGAAVLVLFVATMLSVFKPQGVTPYGRRKEDERRSVSQRPYTASIGVSSDDTGVGSARGSITGTPLWVKVIGVTAIVLLLLFVVLHLTGRGLGHMEHMHGLR